MSNSTEIKNCPFCESNAYTYQNGPVSSNQSVSIDKVGVKCSGCPAEISFGYYANANVASRKLTAIGLWNNRV